MKKIMCYLMCLLVLSVFSLSTLYAKHNDMVIVNESNEYIYNENESEFGTLSEKIINTSNNSIEIEVNFKSDVQTEVVYMVREDELYYYSHSLTSLERLKLFTEPIFNTFNSVNTKVRLAFFAEENELSPWYSKSDEVNKALDNYSTENLEYTENEMDYATTAFTNTSHNKIIIYDYNYNCQEDYGSGYEDLLVIALSNVDDTNGNTICIDEDNINDSLSSLFLKENTSINIPISEEVVSNFDITFDNKNVTFNTENNSLEWNIGTFKPNNKNTFTYKLTLKDNPSDSILEKELSLTSIPLLSYSEGEVNTNTDESSLSIKLISEIPKPDLSIAKYVIITSSLLTIGLIIIVLVRKRKKN